MARVTHVKKARKAYKSDGIKKGDSYYWWKFRYSGKIRSKTPPRPSQLTQSAFLSTLYQIQESIEDYSIDEAGSVSDIECFVDEVKSQIEELRDQCEESRENMPESLQDSPTGELLQERYDALDDWHSELDYLSFDEISKEELIDEVKEELESDPYFVGKLTEAAKSEADSRYSDKLNEMLDEVREIECSL